MVQIIVAEDCGNAPKKGFIRDFNIAFAHQDIAAILDCVTDDVRWNRVGKGRTEGKGAFASALEEMSGPAVSRMVIENIITHGNVGAANGTVTFADGKTFAFCDVYRFGSFRKTARIKEVTSYVIPVQEESTPDAPLR